MIGLKFGRVPFWTMIMLQVKKIKSEKLCGLECANKETKGLTNIHTLKSHDIEVMSGICQPSKKQSLS